MRLRNGFLPGGAGVFGRGWDSQMGLAGGGRRTWPRHRRRLVLVLVAMLVAGGVSAQAAEASESRAYIADNGSDAVTPINVATNEAGMPIPVGEGPYGIAITPNGETAYVTNAAAAR
jgi:YVTN family beta-propeller protein